VQLFSVRGTQICCSPFLLLVIVFLLLCGELSPLMLSLLALSLHEAAHAMMAVGLGCRVLKIELQPFGFVARLDTTADRCDELCIAAAGPLFSLLSAMACFSMGTASGFIRDFGYRHLFVGLINLLPALPLDGGRIVSSGLFLLGFRDQVVKNLSFVIALLLCILGILLCLAGNPSLLILSVFLLFASYREKEQGTEGRVKSYFHRTERLKKGKSLPIRMLALPEETSISEALKLTGGERYTIIAALDASMRLSGFFDEGELLERAAREGMAAKIGRGEKGLLGKKEA